MRKLSCLAFVMMAAVCGGCAGYGAARIDSAPQGAEVVDMGDDTVLGTTPFVYVWSAPYSQLGGIFNVGETRALLVTVRFQKPGYKDKIFAFTVQRDCYTRGGALETPQDVRAELERR